VSGSARDVVGGENAGTANTASDGEGDVGTAGAAAAKKRLAVSQGDVDRAAAAQSAADGAGSMFSFNAQAAALVLSASRGAQHAQVQARCGTCG